MYSSKSARFNPDFDSNNYRQHRLAKVGIKPCRFGFICACLDVTKQLHKQTQILASVARRVGS